MFWQIINGNTSSASWPGSSVFRITDMDSTDPWFLTSELVLSFILSPLISMIGVAGNVLTGVVLGGRRGQQRCSDVLILALAVADTMYLVGTNNVPLRLYLRGEDQPGFYNSEIVSKIFYVLFHAHAILESVGKIVSMILPNVLTLERLLAVFFPFHFSRILTVKRMRVAVVVVFLLSVPEVIIFSSLSKFSYEFDAEVNKSVGRILKSDGFGSLRQCDLIASRVYFILLGPVSISLVVIGCCMIGVRIRLQSRRRKDMTCSPPGLTTQPAVQDMRVRLKAHGLRLLRKTLSTCVASAFCNTRVRSGQSDSVGGLNIKISDGSFNTIHQSDESGNHQYNEQIFEGDGIEGKFFSPTGSEIISEKIRSTTLTLSDDIKTESQPRDQGRALVASHFDCRSIREIEGLKQTLELENKFKAVEETRKVQDTFSTTSITTSIITETVVKTPGRSSLRHSQPKRRTTLVLLSVCVVYSITCGFHFTSIYFVNEENYDFVTCLVVERVGKMALCVNSACNFFIYFLLNRKFREIFTSKCCDGFRRFTLK